MKEDKTKKALITKEQLGIDAINTGMIVAGMMVGHAGTNLIPLENKLIKSGIVTAVGIGIVLIPGSDKVHKFTKPLGYGVLAYGFLSLVRAALVGDSVTAEGQAGIGGVGNSEKVQGVVNFLIPNLGDASPVSVSNFGDHVYDIEERMIEDQPTVDVSGIDDLAVAGAGDAFDLLAA